MRGDIRLKIVTNIDRPHITYDILTVLRKYDIGIKMMEVYTYVLYLKIPELEEDLYNKVIDEIFDIYGVKLVDKIDLVAFEERDIEMKTILDIIPQGVIVMDTRGYIKYSNNYLAERIFNKPSEHLINKNIREFLGDRDLQKNIKNIRNKQVIMNNEIFIADITPIYSELNKVIGYILSMNESTSTNMFNTQISFDDMLSGSDEMYKLFEEAKEKSKDNEALMIIGEAGTGKELLARSIHNHSERKNKNFISISCGDIPEKLLEKELFGSYEDNNRLNLFELADGGTIFFDSIDKMALRTQIKLMELLSKEYTIKDFTGSTHNIDIKIISSCDELVYNSLDKEKYSEKLFKKLSKSKLRIPPLRDRKEEILEFSQFFVEEYSKNHNKEIILTDEALNIILEYTWPGNIRQLQNVLEIAVINSKDGIIEIENLMWGLDEENIIISEESLTNYLDRIERDIIVKNLREHKTIRGTARKLNVTHTLLINRIKKYEILDKEWKD